MVKMVKIEISFGREKMPGGGGRHFGRTGDANLALVPGMEVSLFLSTRMHDNKIYNEVLYKSLKVLS